MRCKQLERIVDDPSSDPATVIEGVAAVERLSDSAVGRNVAVIQTLPPMVEPSPMVMRPRMVAPA
jgi:hypothetical protein